MSEQKKQEQEEQDLKQTEETVETPPAPEEQENQQADDVVPEKTEEEKLKEQIDTLNDRLLRTLAEYDNFRRRSQREKEAVYPQATAAAVTQFLPILDTFDRALGTPCSDKKFKTGVEMILTNFKEVLTKLGVEEFAEAGDIFNPEMHNAVMHIEDSSFGSGTIAEVFQKGYKLGDRIVRHAMVKVAN